MVSITRYKTTVPDFSLSAQRIGAAVPGTGRVSLHGRKAATGVWQF